VLANSMTGAMVGVISPSVGNLHARMSSTSCNRSRAKWRAGSLSRTYFILSVMELIGISLNCFEVCLLILRTEVGNFSHQRPEGYMSGA
jgi:hypothetical protein